MHVTPCAVRAAGYPLINQTNCKHSHRRSSHASWPLATVSRPPKSSSDRQVFSKYNMDLGISARWAPSWLLMCNRRHKRANAEAVHICLWPSTATAQAAHTQKPQIYLAAHAPSAHQRYKSTCQRFRPYYTTSKCIKTHSCTLAGCLVAVRGSPTSMRAQDATCIIAVGLDLMVQQAMM
jgi:hypothetical protein